MKILIVDDHPLVRHGLKQMLKGELPCEQILEAADGECALALLRETPVDLVILDINLPDQSGLDVIKQLRIINSVVPVLVLSMHLEGSIAMRAVRLGADGYVSKESPPEVLIQAIKRLRSGGKHFSSELMYQLLKASSNRETAALHDRLSDREYQVLCLLARGKPIASIAELLELSPNTISTYRTRILDKLNIQTNADLTRYAIEHEII